MAIQFNSDALSRFSNVNFGADDAIANLGENNDLVQNGNRGLGVFAKIRFTSTKANNNAVRTELLKALGQAFSLDGIGEQGGKTTFSQEFMNRLEQILGPAFKRDDFGIGADGVVNSGKPLTQRRIQAVYNAATDYAAQARFNKKFEDVSALLDGQPIRAIMGDDRDEGWSLRLNNLAELAAKVHDVALKLNDEDGASATIVQGDLKIAFKVEYGAIRAKLTFGGKTRRVDLTITSQDLGQRMTNTINALYNSFTEKRDGNLTYGRAALADEALGTYRDLTPEEDLDTTKDCLLRKVAGGLLKEKAGVSDAAISKLTNRDILEIARLLCRTDDVQAVKDAIVSAIKFGKKFEEASALLKGKPISEIVGNNRDAGWDAKVGDFAVLAAKIHDGALTLNKVGDSATVEQGEFKVDLTWGNGGITASLRIDGKTRSVANFATTKEELCIAMDETVSSLYDSFTEKKDGDLTYGRAVLADKVLAYYKEQSEKESKEYLDGPVNCPFRTFASGFLMTKARVTEEQIGKLTNRQLEDFVVMACEAGDVSGIKDIVASTIEELEDEQPVNVEKKAEPPANGEKTYININEI